MQRPYRSRGERLLLGFVPQPNLHQRIRSGRGGFHHRDVACNVRTTSFHVESDKPAPNDITHRPRGGFMQILE